jgi:hypothetical protein
VFTLWHDTTDHMRAGLLMPKQEVQLKGLRFSEWYKEEPTVAGAVSSFYDAREILTDKNGNFNIHGKGFKIMSKVAPMNVLIFKEGYEYVGLYPWESFKVDEILNKKVTWEGKKAVIPLRKMTLEDREKRLFVKQNIPDDKQNLLIKELNKERISIRLTPYRRVSEMKMSKMVLMLG